MKKVCSMFAVIFIYLFCTEITVGQQNRLIWTAESNQKWGLLGMSVAELRKTHQSNSTSIIVGAPTYSNGEEREGAVFLWEGVIPITPKGTPTNVDWSVESNANESDKNIMFGYSVAGAGDVNGDGFQDIIIGAKMYNSNGILDAGKVFVYSGSPSGFSSQPTWTATGDRICGNFGASVATAGDVNGDGYDDIIIGEPGNLQFGPLERCESSIGKVYVWFGSSAGLGLNGTPSNADWAAESDIAGSLFGIVVASAGDVNGDGYADIIVGAPWYSRGETAEGIAFVWYGGPNGLGPTGTPYNANWFAESNQKFAFMGGSVSSAGDINGDGFDDIIVGAHGYDNGEQNEGAAYVWYGGSTGLGITGTPSNAIWRAEGNQTFSNGDGSHFGWAVGNTGDINKDGFSDILISTPYYKGTYENGGGVFIWYGGANGLGENSSPLNAQIGLPLVNRTMPSSVAQSHRTENLQVIY